jgi:dipeptidyl-peptidase-4
MRNGTPPIQEVSSRTLIGLFARGWISLLLCLCLGLAAPRAGGAGDSKVSGELQAQLARLFAAKEFEAKTFGPSRWMEKGTFYVTVEPSAAVAEAQDIVRYDSATGTRSVLVSAASLVPTPGAKPLGIDDSAWSNDGARLLVFTNTKKVWRRNTRGDYWVLDVKEGKLRKLGAACRTSAAGATSGRRARRFCPQDRGWP